MNKHLSLLIIEDLPSDVRFIKEVLKEIHEITFKIVSVDTLKKALKAISSKFDIILLDLNLPDSKGIDTFNSVKKKAINIPLIILTVIEDKMLMIDAVRTGAQDFFVKRLITSDSLNRAITYGIERKIAEFNLKKVLNDLRLSNEELQNFAYMMSHDLQDPLKTISNYLLLIQRRYSAKLDKNGNEFINFTIEASKKMQILINDLLTYSRITINSENYASVDLNKVFNEAVKNLEGLKVKSITHDKLPKVKGIYSQLIIVFQNLISNALKFCKKTPKIHISYKKEKYNHIILFKDNGIGIKLKDYEKLFKAFERINSQSKYEGTGLGLAIVKKIIERHNGKIWFTSVYGKGSTFYIQLPNA